MRQVQKAFNLMHPTRRKVSRILSIPQDDYCLFDCRFNTFGSASPYVLIGPCAVAPGTIFAAFR
ncbi:hypothetical protein LX36DRAFT_654664 [Colletotrichum falcatum]|nr:hypothetical protein LX36DRAFT_654664 [Colletotrichum falcatum]